MLPFQQLPLRREDAPGGRFTCNFNLARAVASVDRSEGRALVRRLATSFLKLSAKRLRAGGWRRARVSARAARYHPTYPFLSVSSSLWIRGDSIRSDQRRSKKTRSKGATPISIHRRFSSPSSVPRLHFLSAQCAIAILIYRQARSQSRGERG